MFELTVHFKHEMIGIWQRFQRNFELSELRINRVRINRARPVVNIFVTEFSEFSENI